MGGDGFTVDYDGLESVGEVLGDLAQEFDGLEDHVEGYADAVASDDVAGELERVASNWSDDRKDLVEKMENASEYATQAAAAYRDLDTGLASEYSGQGGGSGGGGGGSY